MLRQEFHARRVSRPDRDHQRRFPVRAPPASRQNETTHNKSKTGRRTAFLKLSWHGTNVSYETVLKLEPGGIRFESGHHLRFYG